jgi:molybdopterin-binding protein
VGVGWELAWAPADRRRTPARDGLGHRGSGERNGKWRATEEEGLMRYGARNKIDARVTSVKRGDVMSLVKFEVQAPARMASVLTTESVDEMDLKPGDEIELIIKAIHVLPVKEKE